MTLSRRKMIRLVGGGAVFAAGGAFGLAASRNPRTAFQPWDRAGAYDDPRMRALSWALLAPNPHNRQPWIADLAQPGHIGLVCDGERLLPETDPFGRQILIGCGAFIELAVIAAAQRGVAVAVQLFPDGAPAADALPRGAHVAVLQLREAGSAQPDPLFAQIPRRHTNKTAYANDRALPAQLTMQWAQTAQRFGLASGVVVDAVGMDRLRAVTREAYAIETTTPRTWLESAHLMRIGPGAIARHRDGISLNGTLPRLMHAVGLFDPLEVPEPGSGNLQRAMERWAACETGSGYLWLASSGNTRALQVDAGRAYVRQQLQASAAGVQMHPLSQALQEFPEVRGPRAAVHQALGLDPQRSTLQMLARTGFALQPAQPSPRRGLQAMLRA